MNQRVLATLGKNHGSEVVAKSVLITLNSSEALSLLKAISNDEKFTKQEHFLPQYLSLYIVSNAQAKQVEEYLKLIAVE